MAENEELENGFELAETDAELDSFLELETEDGTPFGGDPPPLAIPMSPEQAAQVLAEKEAAEQEAAQLEQQQSQVETPDLISQLLEAKGWKDGLIKIEEEDGTQIEVSFDDLSPEEQFDILNSAEENPANLAEHEERTLKFLRDNQVTLEEAIEYFSKKAVEEALQANSVTESVAEFSDDEIYALDLVNRVKTITEEEIQIELDKQKEHPELFKKKVDALRDEYLQLEKDEITQKEQEIQKKEEEEFTRITESLVEVARQTEDIGGLDIELEDKQEVLGFILNKDVNGVTEFGKLLEDPKALFEIAWYAKKGKEAFDVIHDYYKKEISDASKKAYEKGKAEATPTAPVAPVEKESKLRSSIRNKITQSTNSSVQALPPVEDLYRDL